MSYTELEHGYQGLRKARPAFYFGDEGTVRFLKARGNLTELGDDDSYGEDGKQVVVGVCAMAKKSQSKPMKEILTRLQEFEFIKMIVFTEDDILKAERFRIFVTPLKMDLKDTKALGVQRKPVEEWPICDCLISFHSKGFPLDKAIQYATLRKPFIINNLHMQYDIQDRRKVYSILESEGIEIPRYAVLDRDSPDPKHHELIESEDHVEVNGIVFNKPFVEKPVSAEDHNIYIYYPTSAGGGSQRLFRKIGSRSSVYSPESRVRKTGSFIYEDFMPTDGTDVKVYTVGPDYAHAEARKSPALDGKVERDSEGKEVRYPVILSNAEKLISRKVCLAFKQTVCGFDLLRANGKSFVCDVNGFSFVKNSNKYYDDCAKILGNMILRELAPTLHIPWSVPFQLDDPPIVPTTFGKMMELRCVVAVIRHGDRTPKQKMKVEVRHPKFFEIFEKYGGRADGHVKLKRPKQLQEILDIARSLLNEIEHRAADPEIEEKQGKLEQLKSVLEMYGHFSGINRKVQMKYQPKGRPRGSSSDDGKDNNTPKEPSLVLILKWGGELTPAGRIQAEELGKIFRCMYPGGQGRHAGGEYAGKQGLGLLRLHSTFRHDLKIYASDEGRVQMTAAAFAKGLLALEGELTPILVQMVKSANTNGLLDNDCDASKHQNMAKAQLHHLMQQNRDFTPEDRSAINPCNAISISMAMDFVKNPVKCCERVQDLIQKLMNIVRTKKDDPKTKDAVLYHGETWELMGRRWGKIEKDFCTKNKTYDISKIPDIYDCIKYDLQHNQHTLQFDQAEELYINAKNLADIVIPQEYGLTVQEKLTISQGICTPLLKKIRADLQRNIEETGEETVNRLNPRYSHGVSSPGRHVRTRLYFTSESHVHSLLTVLRYGGLIDNMKDEQWRRAMEYVSMVSELNYMSQIVVMLYEDPTKDPSSDERFHVELHFSPGVNCCVQKNLPPGPGFRPHSRNEQSQSQSQSTLTGRIEQEDNYPKSDLEDSSTPQTPARCDSPGTEGNSPSVEKKTIEISARPKKKTSDPIPINVTSGKSDAVQVELAVRLDDEQAKRSLSFSLSAQTSNSPEREPRSRSFDHSREQRSKGNEAGQLDSGKDESVSEEDILIIQKKERYEKNLLDFNSRITKVSKSNKCSKKSDIQSLISKTNKFAAIRFKHLNIFGNRSRSVDLSSDQSIPCKDKLDLAYTLFSKGKKPERKWFASNKMVLEEKMASSTEINLQALDLAHVEVFTHREKKIVSDRMKKNTSFPQVVDLKKNNLGALKKQNLADQTRRVQNEGDDKFVTSESLSQFKRYVKKKSHSYKSSENQKSPHSLRDIKTGRFGNEITGEKYDSLSVSCARNEFLGNSQDLNLSQQNLSESSKPLITLTHSKCDQGEIVKTESVKDNLKLPRTPKPIIERRTQSVSHCLGLTHLSPPDPGPSRRHRHSISGQMSYFHTTGYGLIVQNQRRGGSTNSLFSTAVISGSSSAPNLRDMIPNTAAVAAALEGCGGVPLIRPLETLHNALSLRQLDSFLDKMSRALLYRTPLSSPPKHPSTPVPQSVQSPNNSLGWSGPPSFVSSSGPSSPNGLSDFFRGGIGTSDSSDFSASIISNDGFKFGAGPSDTIANAAFGVDTHISDSLAAYTHRDSIEVAELYNTQQAFESMQFYPIKADGGDSGDLTPVSLGSEVDPCDFTATQCCVGLSHLDSLEECEIATCDDEDEEMTLTAFTKEEMSRPKLAEIKWIQDDVPIQPQPEKHALGRFECIGAVCDASSEQSTCGEYSGMSGFQEYSMPGEQSSLSKIPEGVFEMDSEGESRDANQSEDRRMSNDELQSCFHFGPLHNFERRYSSISTRNASPEFGSPINPSPVLTLASSLKDDSCISRGFVLPKQDSKEDE